MDGRALMTADATLPRSNSRVSQVSNTHSHPSFVLVSSGRAPQSRLIWLLNEKPSGYPSEQAMLKRLASEFCSLIVARRILAMPSQWDGTGRVLLSIRRHSARRDM